MPLRLAACTPLLLTAHAIIALAPLQARGALPRFPSAEAIASPPEDAQDADHLLRDTETIASSQHKNVLLIFSASWCGSCHSLESFLADPVMRPLFDRNFVRLVLDDGEHSDDTRHHNTIGADHLRVSFHGTDAGLPFIVMLDRSGKAHRGFSSPRIWSAK